MRRLPERPARRHPRATRRGGLRPIGEVFGVEDIRRVWWSQIRQGNRLPAQIGIVVIMGGKP